MKKNLLTIILSAAFIVIWGIVIYRIVIYFTSLNNTEADLLPDSPSISLKQNENKISQGNYKISRDPFELHVIKAEKVLTEQEAAAVKAARKFTKYKINGVVASQKNFLVILENLADKSVHFLRPGETYNEIKIIKATPKLVTIMIYEDVKEVEL